MKKTLIIAGVLTAVCIALILLKLELAKPAANLIRLYGNVDIRQVDISFQVGGKVQKMLFEEGERVKKGAVLAELDDRDYRENYLQTLAEIKRATAARDEAQDVLNTNQPLCGQGFTSQRLCRSYTNALAEAEGTLESAEVAKRYAENQLAYTKIYAPDDGTITTRAQEPGAIVSAGQIIYTLAKDRPVWVRAYIPETHLGHITYGSKARIITDSKDPETGKKREYSAYVGYISPVAEFTPKSVQTEDLRTDLVYRINVYADEPDDFLRQGMPTTIEITY